MDAERCNVFYIHVTVHRDKFPYNKTKLCTMTLKNTVLLCSYMFLGYLRHFYGAFTPTFKTY
jgi:hypothetical protein